MQLVNGVELFQKMRKSLGNKRNELGKAHIETLAKTYGEFLTSGNPASCLQPAPRPSPPANDLVATRPANDTVSAGKFLYAPWRVDHMLTAAGYDPDTRRHGDVPRPRGDESGDWQLEPANLRDRDLARGFDRGPLVA